MSRTLRYFDSIAYIPKERIRRKLEKAEYRERYQTHVNGRANYNSHGKLCWIDVVTASEVIAAQELRARRSQ